LIVGQGAQQFAQEQGISLCRLEDLMTERQYNNWKAATSATPVNNVGADLSSPPPQQSEAERISILRSAEEKHGTVGAVALDTFGTLAAATSTGGIENKYPGRVGDSPLIGCGFYADENGAISCTGHGEDFIRLLIAKRAADFVARGDTARDAAQAAIAVLGARATGTGGLIVVDRLGNVGFAWNSEHMSHAYMIEGMDEPMTGV
jgi:L-asparaginase / beta-aspartyl-peptidase